MTDSSRVKRYKELREGIKEEAGINREPIDKEETTIEEDDFLSFMKQDEKAEINIEDTITEAKTFEQIRKESNEEIERALRSAKSNVGKEEQYNTRIDILNKIRHPEKEVIKIDKMENMRTEQFAKGYFIKNDVTKEEADTEVTEEVKEKKKMTLMERLALMSPKEDVEKVEQALQKEEMESLETEPLVEPEPVEEVYISKEVVIEEIEDSETGDLVKKNSRDQKIVTILNYVIIALVVAFVLVCIMIVYQIFF